jgi:hypothetical protein
MTLPDSVIKLDHELSSSTSMLIEVRWHWTLDESNPERVSISEYGRRVGVSQRTISAFAHARILLVDGRAKTAQEAIERAHMSEETQAAAEAVAEIHGVSFGSASKYYRDDIRFVRELAREQAEENDSDFWTALPDAIEALRLRVAHRGLGGGQPTSHSRMFINVDSRLILVREKVASCVEEVRRVESDIGKEEIDALSDRIAEVQALLDTLSGALSGSRGGIALVS